MQMQLFYEWINLFNSAEINQTFFPLQSVIKELIKTPKKPSKTKSDTKKKVSLRRKKTTQYKPVSSQTKSVFLLLLFLFEVGRIFKEFCT